MKDKIAGQSGCIESLRNLDVSSPEIASQIAASNLESEELREVIDEIQRTIPSDSTPSSSINAESPKGSEEQKPDRGVADEYGQRLLRWVQGHRLIVELHSRGVP